MCADRGRQLEPVVFHIQYEVDAAQKEGEAHASLRTWELVNMNDAKAAIALHNRTERNNRKHNRPGT